MQEKLWGCRQDLEDTMRFIMRPDYRFDCMTDDLNAEEEEEEEDLPSRLIQLHFTQISPIPLNGWNASVACSCIIYGGGETTVRGGRYIFSHGLKKKSNFITGPEN